MPIVKVWPEFGANGKEAATLRHALSHRTGVPQTPVGYTPEWLADWDRMCRGIADLKPMYPDRRADRLSLAELRSHQRRDPAPCRWPPDRAVPARRDLQAARINGICPGVPDSELRRVAVLTDAPPAPADYDARMVGEPAGSQVAKVFNRPEIQKAAIPGSGGIMSARGLARHYAMLANWGELDGVRIMPEARSVRASSCRASSGTRSIACACGAPRLAPRQRLRPAGFARSLWPCRRRRFVRLRGSREASGHRFREELFHLQHRRCGQPGPAPRAASNMVAEAVFDALGLSR